MATTSANTLLATLEWAKKLNFGRRSALGNFLEPALTSANMTLQTVLGPPFAWRWNRVVIGFVTVAGQQDYLVLNWAPTADLKLTWMTVDDAGNSQTVTTAGTTGTVPPNWNHTKGGTTTDGSVVWTNLGSIGTPVAQTYRFGWIETVSVQDTSYATPQWKEITPKLGIAMDSEQSRPTFIAAQSDDGQGNVLFRMLPVPDTAYPVAITLQQKAPVMSSINQTWAPIPDDLAHIYNWGFLSLMWLFADDPRFGTANQKFVAGLLATSEGLTETERNIFLHNWQLVTGQPIQYANTKQQGMTARGV